MAYHRKTVDRWDIVTNFGYGWERECSEYDLVSAKRTLREYLENSYGRYAVRLEKHREKVDK